MASPAADLFNDASLAAGWGVVQQSGSASLVEEGPSGTGQLVVSGISGFASLPASIDRATYGPLQGDFDIAVVLVGGGGDAGVVVETIVGLYKAGDLATYQYVTDQNGGPWKVFDYLGGVFASGMRRAIDARVPRDRMYQWVRLTRSGSSVTISVMQPDGTWAAIGAAGRFTETGDVTLFIASDSNSGAATKVYVRAMLPLVAGALAAPAAPTGGKAASSPSTDDTDLGVMAVWTAPASNVAREVQIQSATDSGFTLNVRPHDHPLIDGQKPTARRPGLSAGTTIYFRARFVDELGQAGTWSSTVSAAAAVTPSANVEPMIGNIQVVTMAQETEVLFQMAGVL